MKIFAISKGHEYFRIGDTSDTKDWYTKTTATKDVCESLNKGDEVNIQFEVEGSKKLLTVVNITKKTERAVQTNGDNKFRTPNEIRRDETMRSACLAISAMPGQFSDVSALTGAIVALYDKLLEKTR